MHEVPITEIFDLLERYNGMVPLKSPAKPRSRPIRSIRTTPLVRAAAEELLAQAKACASRAA